MQEKDKEITSSKILNEILDSAIKDGASDIHIEPLSDRLRIRFRIDGRLREKFERPFYETEAIINRIKVMANLELVSKQIPQDGHFELVETAVPKKPDPKSGPIPAPKSVIVKNISDIFSKTREETGEGEIRQLADKKGLRVVNLRVSIFPSIHGDAAVLRLLDQESMIMSLEAFELHPDDRARLKTLIAKSFGMVLVTGPSGSGKTSMLYSILMALKSNEKNIITLEDPVEYALEDIRQSQVNPEQGFSFAAGMKSILRQDPDIVMIGEIRDPETAEYAIRASLMGRAVFSTVHSNSSVGILARLFDMGIERSLVAYALNGSISKRLVRRVCSACKTHYTPDEATLEYFGLDPKKEYNFVKGAGCDLCGKTGYKGRIGIFEIMEMDEGLKSLIMEKVPMSVLQAHLAKSGMRNLKQDIVEKALAGHTTLEEAIGAV